MSEKIDELYVSLNLDISEWEKNYQVANRKVKEVAQKLTNENKANRVKLQLELLGADASSNKVSSLNRQMGILNEMVETQRQKVTLTQNAYSGLASAARVQHNKLSDSVSKTDDAYKKLNDKQKATQAASVAMAANVGKEQVALAKLEAQLRNTASAREAAYKAMATSALGFVDTTTLVMSAVGVLSTKLAMTQENEDKRFNTTFGSSASGMREWSEDAARGLGTANDGLVVFDDNLRVFSNDMYMMLDNMGMTRNESMEFAKQISVLSYNLAAMQGRNPEEVFEKLKAGVAGQTRGLKELNIVINDSNIAEYAYKNGIAAVGATLDDHQKKVATLGLIQQQTADATNYMARNAEDAQVKTLRAKGGYEDLAKALGKDLLPAYKDLLGILSDLAKIYNKLNENAEGAGAQIIETGMEIRTLNSLPIPLWAKAVGDVAIGAGNLFAFGKKQEASSAANATEYLTGNKPSDTQANVRWNEETGTYQKEVLKKVLWGKEKVDWEDVVGEERENLVKQIELNQQKISEAENKNQGMSDAERERETAKTKALLEADVKVKKEILDETYKLTHSELENELKDVEEKAKEYREKKVDELTIAQYVEAAKSKIMQDFQNETLAKIREATETELQIKLNAIEKEKEAYRKKGVDEVEATKWAEEEKRKAIQNVALDAIKNDRKLLEEIKSAMTSSTLTYTKNGETFTKEFSSKDRLNQIVQNRIDEGRKKLGITSSDKFTAEQIQMYQQIKDSAQNNLIPGLERLPGAASSVSPKYIQAPVTITIDKPVVMDNTALNEIANQVAGVIEPAIDKAINNTQNSY